MIEMKIFDKKTEFRLTKPSAGVIVAAMRYN